MITTTSQDALLSVNSQVIANGGLGDAEFRLKADGEYYYALIFRPMTWQEAESLATKIPGGWHLTSVHGSPEHGFLCTLAATYNVGCFWIGLSDNQQENNWRWSDGTPLDFSAWHPGEPNNRNDEDFVVCITGDRDWNDYRGDVRMPSIIKRPR